MRPEGVSMLRVVTAAWWVLIPRSSVADALPSCTHLPLSTDRYRSKVVDPTCQYRSRNIMLMPIPFGLDLVAFGRFVSGRRAMDFSECERKP
jgi:hypothetical protein